MAKYEQVEAAPQDLSIHLQFKLDKPAVLGWQAFDPVTGVFLCEGEWSGVYGPAVDLSMALPPQDGPYRVHIAPVANRDRFIMIDARIADGQIEMDAPRVASAAGLRRERLLQAIPKAF